MKKRILSFALILTMMLPLAPTALAAGSFTDIWETETARNVEVLRLMGVVNGDENGGFQPYSDLTRAAFCKMAVELLGEGDQILRWRTRTIFPDVRASHWAAGYINLAANHSLASGGEKDAVRLIHGLPDGTFAPNRAITFGEAVTIVMRILGYTDEMTGGIWPQGYLDLAAANGVTKGINVSGSEPITRAQAAQLFVNILRSKTASGTDFMGSRSELTTLLWIDGGTGRMRTTDGSYTMAKPMASTVLTGSHGYVLLDAEKRAVTFLPLSGSNVGVTNAAVIAAMDGVTDGFDALTGGEVDCAIYKSGTEIAPHLIRKNDVATYSAAGNSIQLCDTRVTVKYENCAPSPRQPATITVLNGLTLNVLQTAQQSLSKFKPGDTMTLLLTASGDVAGAITPNNDSRSRANAIGIVGNDGKVSMLCGTEMIRLPDAVTAEELLGRAVSIEQGKNGKVKVTELEKTKLYGELDAVTRMIGGVKLSGSVQIFDQGENVTLRAIANGGTTTSQVAYAHLNSVGEYDLIVLGVPTKGDVYWGRVMSSVEGKDDPGIDPDELPEGMELPEILYWDLTIAYGEGKTVQSKSYQQVHEGNFIEAVLYKNLDGSTVFNKVRSMAVLENVEPSAFIGTTAVVVDGRTYAVAENIPCYNRDTGLWMNDDVEAALVYAGTVNVYLSDNVVRAIEVIG